MKKSPVGHTYVIAYRAVGVVKIGQAVYGALPTRLVIHRFIPSVGLSKMQKKRNKPKVVPRRSPATNLRKAGAHEDKKRKTIKTLDQKEGDDLVALGSWAFDEEGA